MMHRTLAVTTLLLASACGGPRHLGKDTGQAFYSAFDRQPQRKGQPPRGLNASDADIVLTNYRNAALGNSGGSSSAPAPAGISLQAK